MLYRDDSMSARDENAGLQRKTVCEISHTYSLKTVLRRAMSAMLETRYGV